MKKKLPIGRSDFKEVIASSYYIDKSKLIEDIIVNNDKNILFCRPRRFGKTLNLSMLYYFFSNKNEGLELFNHLEVSNNLEIMKYHKKYPTIFISLKDLGSTKEQFLEFIKLKIAKLILQYKIELGNSKIFENIIKSYNYDTLDKLDINFITPVLLKLVDILHEYYNEKVIILIDEYDNALHTSATGGYENEVIDFLRNLLSPVLKDNEKVELSVMTGILRVTKESIFSGLNNLIVNDTLSDEYSNYFGFTSSEVKVLLKDFDQSERYDEIKKWYNGYLFGKTVIYNPWSTINSVRYKKVDTYWVNTGSNEILKIAFKHLNDIEKIDIPALPIEM